MNYGSQFRAIHRRSFKMPEGDYREGSPAARVHAEIFDSGLPFRVAALSRSSCFSSSPMALDQLQLLPGSRHHPPTGKRGAGLHIFGRAQVSGRVWFGSFFFRTDLLQLFYCFLHPACGSVLGQAHCIFRWPGSAIRDNGTGGFLSAFDIKAYADAGTYLAGYACSGNSSVRFLVVANLGWESTALGFSRAAFSHLAFLTF